MKLEKKQDKIISTKHFVIRVGKYALLSGIVILISLLIGMIGYRLLGELSWVDSFHMTCMILTGMGPVAEMKTNPAKLFSSLYALYSGIAFLSITAVFLTPILHRLLHILHFENENEEDSFS
ncbi:MAG: hypothetical protein IT267_09825 [Saprospiraceae bacterium]|nr:hypothetical protein [Saprospiraceae bacterium]